MNNNQVPLPLKFSGKRGEPRYPWGEMKIGDSIEVENKKIYNIQQNATEWAKRNNKKWYFTSRKTGENVGRIWRVPKSFIQNQELEYKIEKNVPMPKHTSRRYDLYKLVLRLKIGESILISHISYNSLYNHLYNSKFLEKRDLHFKVKAENKGSRVWRVL